ncbi:heat shock 70 kDa protein 14-like isoform X2 [Oscarella lobularis]
MPIFAIDWAGKPKTFTPTQLATILFAALKDTATSGSGETGSNLRAVLAAPYNFSDKQKTDLKEAATSAGFKIERIICEPAAAALAYNIGQDNPNEKKFILVFRLGGQSLDVTIILVAAGMYQVIANKHVSGIGGNLIDTLVAAHLATEFQRIYKIDIRENRRAMYKLGVAAEEAKRTLSSSTTASIDIDSLHEGQSFQQKIGRAKFESLCSHVLSQCIQVTKDVLSGEKLIANQVILCGGCSRIPLLKQMLLDALPGVSLLNGISPDEVIALGAAEQCMLVNENILDKDETIPCTSYAILAKVLSGELVPLVAKHVPLPMKVSRSVSLSKDSRITVYESESDAELVNERLLTEINFSDETNVDFSKPVKLTCNVARDSSVTLLAV